jgi:formate dehydrogenase subunit gamma
MNCDCVGDDEAMTNLIRALLAFTLATLLGISASFAQSSVRPPANAVTNATPGAPGTGGPASEDAQFWKKVRGVEGTVSIPDKKAGVLVQSSGEAWREFRNGPLPRYGAYGMIGTLLLLAAFYFVRGRIRLDHGWAGRTIERFGELDRMAHWLMAVSFIILGLTGLNTLYGRSVLLPVIGKEAFAALSATGKTLHNYVAFAFMLGLALAFVLWIKDNIPGPRDVVWLLKGGGMFSKGSHPPAWKFNAGQKILFWLIMLAGLSISLSGLELMFPFKFALFAKTFGLLGSLGFGVPATVSSIQEMQFASAWHAIMGLVLVCVIFAHIYIGTLGMEGAFDAMATGHVDENWAKEHHSLWAERAIAERDAAGKTVPGRGGLQPAE